MDEPVLNKIILAGYELLDLQTYLPPDLKKSELGQFIKMQQHPMLLE